MLDRCIQQEPTLLELYSVQCKIFKHAGDPEAAAAAADKARSMDLADRYCTAICAVTVTANLEVAGGGRAESLQGIHC